MSHPTPHALSWHDNGVPFSDQFDDPFYSVDNGLEETRHVFLGGNDLPARFQDGFHIAELGFGTGLNLLAAAQAWQASGIQGTLQFTSFEAFPLYLEAARRAHANFPEVAGLAAELAPLWSGDDRVDLGWLKVHIIAGDARSSLPAWGRQADAWFLDGFSPAKNPELWGGDLMRSVGRQTAPGGTCATYTAAGFVRRALEAGGFKIERVPGFGRKRHMTRGVKK